MLPGGIYRAEARWNVRLKEVPTWRTGWPPCRRLTHAAHAPMACRQRAALASGHACAPLSRAPSPVAHVLGQRHSVAEQLLPRVIRQARGGRDLDHLR